MNRKPEDDTDLLGAPTRGRRVPVLLPYPFAGPFDYRVPRELDPQPGDIVLVPLNRREEIGVVWDGEADGTVGDNRLRALISVLDVPPIREDIRKLVDWIAAYTLTPPGEVLTMALRTNAFRPEPIPAGWRLAETPPEIRLTDARKRVIAALSPGETVTSAELARRSDATAAVIRGLADAGVLEPATLIIAAPFPAPDPAHPGPTLPIRNPPPPACATPSPPAPSPSPCSKASPAPAKPRSISKPSPPACAPAAKLWCCCRKSPSPPNGSPASPAASAWRRPSGTPTSPPAPAASPGAKSPAAPRKSSSAPARPSSSPSPTSASW